MTLVPVHRSAVMLRPDSARLIPRTYLPHHDAPPSTAGSRVDGILARVLALDSGQEKSALAGVRERFAHKYPDLDALLLDSFAIMEPFLGEHESLGVGRRQLIGAYFLQEYAVEGAALTNPSIVPHPDQEGVEAGAVRVVVSLRAVGEGHISSIEFRAGEVGPTGEVRVDSPLHPVRGVRRSPTFDKMVFTHRLVELGVDEGLVGLVLGSLAEHFAMADLDAVLAELETGRTASPVSPQVAHTIHWLAASNYEVHFPADSHLSQRILTPNGPTESNGMEDARFVRFTEQDGSIVYYGTYTAYDGVNILPQLVRTTDFEQFRVATLNGSAALNKGIALFPRRVGGRYAALGRSDGESNYLMFSDHIRLWGEAERIQVPTQPWELFQVGNAGSPIETEAGWLVITHGVGPVRQYALGAMLLDLDDPSRVIGHLPEPLLEPDSEERDGYVPNVVYSCGSLTHEGSLIIAYGASDTLTRFATVSVDDLFRAIRNP